MGDLDFPKKKTVDALFWELFELSLINLINLIYGLTIECAYLYIHGQGHIYICFIVCEYTCCYQFP